MVAENLQDIFNKKKDSPKITDVILWLDCDREGEAICFEVLETLFGTKIEKKSFEIAEFENRTGVRIHRAKFSAATKSDIENALKNPQQVDIN